MRTQSEKRMGRQSIPQKDRKCPSPEVGPKHQKDNSGLLEMGWQWGEAGTKAHSDLLC